MNCAFCQKETTEKKIHFRDDCPACGRDLHICLNCEFYDPNAYCQCKESIRELVQDKERANYCDFFRPSAIGASGPVGQGDTLNKLNDLFK
jgi:hypothetical protein